MAALVKNGPNRAIDGVVRWHRKDLVAWLHEEFGLVVGETTLGRELRGSGGATSGRCSRSP